MELNSNQIAQLLPHRFPFALVDRITAVSYTHLTLPTNSRV